MFTTLSALLGAQGCTEVLVGYANDYVFSKTMHKSPDKNVEIISDNMIAFVRGLKQKEGKDIWLVGGAELASQLFAERLIDDLTLKVNPVLFGSGLSLFSDIVHQTELELVNSLYFQVATW